MCWDAPADRLTVLVQRVLAREDAVAGPALEVQDVVHRLFVAFAVRFATEAPLAGGIRTWVWPVVDMRAHMP